MDEGRYPPQLRISQHRKRRITADTNDCIRMKAINNMPHLEKTLHQLPRKGNIFYQRTPVEACYIQPLNFKTCLRNLLHFHFSFGAHKQDRTTGIATLQRIGDGNGRENMPAGAAACYDKPL